MLVFLLLLLLLLLLLVRLLYATLTFQKSLVTLRYADLSVVVQLWGATRMQCHANYVLSTYPCVHERCLFSLMTLPRL